MGRLILLRAPTDCAPQALGTHLLPLPLVRSILLHHRLSCPSALLEPVLLRQLLRELYQQAGRTVVGAAGRARGQEAEVLASLLEQILDPGHQVGGAARVLTSPPGWSVRAGPEDGAGRAHRCQAQGQAGLPLQGAQRPPGRSVLLLPLLTTPRPS